MIVVTKFVWAVGLILLKTSVNASHIGPQEIIRSNFPPYARCEGTLSMTAYNKYSNENKDVLNIIQEPGNSRPIMHKNIEPKQDLRNWQFFIRNSGSCCWKLYSK